MSVLVVLEQNAGQWNRMSFEALAAAQKIAQALNTPLEAAVIGAAPAALAKEAAAYPVAKVFALEHALLAHYTPEGYTAALEQLIKSSQPAAVVFPHTYQVRDYVPKLATRFSQAFVSDVVDIKTDAGEVSFVRQLFQGKLNAAVVAKGRYPVRLRPSRRLSFFGTIRLGCRHRRNIRPAARLRPNPQPAG